MRSSEVNNIARASVVVVLLFILYIYMTSPATASGSNMPTLPSDQVTRVVLERSFVEDRKSSVQQQNFNPANLVVYRNNSFDYNAAMKELNDAKVSQDDPRLIRIIRDYYIDPPSMEPYNLLNPERLEYSNGQTPFIDSRLNYTDGGFYIECGALNGEKGSNTLFFEKVRKWNGLLIEADPDNYKVLKSKNRKAFSLNVCLNTQPYPALMVFNKAFNMGRIVHNKEGNDWVKRLHIKENEVLVQCFPLYSILLALNQTTIDFFSLDIEGDELNVLRTIPWNKVNIKMLTVEYAHGAGSAGSLTTYMEQKGYDTLLHVSRSDWGVNDVIFRKKGLTH